MSLQMINGRPVNMHEIHARATEDSQTEVFKKSSRWDTAALGASLLKQGYVSVVPMSYAKSDDDQWVLGYDDKTWEAIQKNLKGKEQNAARLTVQQSAHLEEAGRLMEVCAKQGKKSGLSEDQLYEMLHAALSAFVELGVKQADVRDALSAILHPRVAEQPAEAPAQ